MKFTVKQAAAKIGETVHVIRHWLRTYGEAIPHERTPSGYRLFDQAGLDALKRVQLMHREQKLTAKQVKVMLVQEAVANEKPSYIKQPRQKVEQSSYMKKILKSIFR